MSVLDPEESFGRSFLDLAGVQDAQSVPLGRNHRLGENSGPLLPVGILRQHPDGSVTANPMAAECQAIETDFLHAIQPLLIVSRATVDPSRHQRIKSGVEDVEIFTMKMNQVGRIPGLHIEVDVSAESRILRQDREEN